MAPSFGQDPSVVDPQLPALAVDHDPSFGGPALCPPWAAQVWLAWLLGFWPWLPPPNRSACDLLLQQLLLLSSVVPR